MTEAARRLQIERALAAHQKEPSPERREFPLSTGSKVLDVITLPLDVPVLNTKSFRIAPALADHPDAQLVAADPDSDAAQKVVSDLVRARHSKAEALKQSLIDDGQQEPGVITRSGVLINANSRCVLMRELLSEAKLRHNAIKVAVLPEDFPPAALLDLEAVLQLQTDLKDDYDLVGELMMLNTLHVEAHMTKEQIAKRQRTTAAKVLESFNILALMERARHLREPAIKIAEFGGPKGQRENWKSIMLQVEKADASGHKEAGDEVLRLFLGLHTLDAANVHGLRTLTPDWVGDQLIDALEEHGETGAQIAKSLQRSIDQQERAEAPEADESLDILDFGSNNAQPTTGSAAKAFLDLAREAKDAGYAEVTLADGSTLPGNETFTTLKNVSNALHKDAESRLAAGAKIDRPVALLAKSLQVATLANKALEKAVQSPEFTTRQKAVETALADIEDQVKEARKWLKTVKKP